MSVPWMPFSMSWTKIVGDLVLVAVEERLRQVVVRVDAGGEHDVQPALVSHPLAEGRVAVEEHGARLDDRPDAVALDGVRVGHGRLPLGVLVVEVRELEARGLVGGAEVLVDEREPELVQLDGPVDGFDSGQCSSPPVRCRGEPNRPRPPTRSGDARPCRSRERR